MSYAVASLCICHVHLRACGSHPRWVALEEVIHRTLSWRVLCNINLFRAYRLYYRRCPSALLIRDTLQLDAPAGRYQPRVPELGVPPAGVTTYNEDLFLPQGPLAVLLVSALLLSDVHRMDCIDQIAVAITSMALLELFLRFLRMRSIVEAVRTSACEQFIFGILNLLPITIHAHLLNTFPLISNSLFEGRFCKLLVFFIVYIAAYTHPRP